MNKVRQFEEMAANGHVALNVMQYDGWLLKFSKGYTGRANSVSVLYPSTIDLEEKIEYCEQQYKKQGLPSIFKLTEIDGELNELLVKHGYKLAKSTELMSMKIGDEEYSTESCVFTTEPTEEWLKAYFEYEEINDAWKQEVFREMLSKVFVDTIYCGLVKDGKIIACVSAAIEQGYMLMQNVVVSPEYRGQGYGRKVCCALIQKAKESGAEYTYLQVMQNNPPALNLYKSLGYKREYEYWYMKKEV